MQHAVATMFVGDGASLDQSATAAGYLGELPQNFVMSGQSAGGGFATAVGGYYAADPADNSSLRGVVMFEGVSFNGVVTNSLHNLNDPFIPVYQVAAPPQSWNFTGPPPRSWWLPARVSSSARPSPGIPFRFAAGRKPDLDLFLQLVTVLSARQHGGRVHAGHGLDQ